MQDWLIRRRNCVAVQTLQSRGGALVQEGQSTVEDYDRLADFDASSVDGITKSLGRAVDEMDDVCPLRFLRVRLKKMNSKRERLTSGYPFEYKSA